MPVRMCLPRDEGLRAFIEYYWFLTNDDNDGDTLSIIPPEAAFDVVLSFAGPTSWFTNDDRRINIKQSFLGGIRNEPYFIQCQDEVDYLSIRFHPQSIFNFTHFPLTEIYDQVIDLDLLDGTLFKDLHTRIGDIQTDEGRVRELDEIFNQFLSREEPETPGMLTYALTSIRDAGGCLRISDLCDKLGIYPEKLERVFKKYIGITPKYYSQIVRFNKVLDFVHHKSDELVWSSTAGQFGYYDQAHLIHDFKRFTGYTPQVLSQMLGELS